jgi:type IV pilus assembly protein PilY1
MIQVVQGYCFSTSTKIDGTGNWQNPSSTSFCNGNFNPVNKPVMGGVLHSSPAIVSASSRMNDSGAPRPTVMYVTSADGQLHAFYVSGGVGYTGPGAQSSTFANKPASAVFNTTWPSPFTAPEVLTELWSFMPASQLPLLSQNAQLIDSAPVVQDVFADFGGTGIREWHTVIVATAGGPLGTMGSEVFALDITNPLKPVILWDMMGSWNGPVGTVPPIELANFTGSYPGGIGYVQTYRGLGYPAAGLQAAQGVYDYRHIGASYGLSLGVVRTGNDPTFPVFVATNFTQDILNVPMVNGMQVYSIDTVSGQIIWHWMQPYATSGNIPGDPVPQAASLIPDQYGNLNVLYAGDMEGNVWELPARTGINPWTGQGVGNTGAIFRTGTTAANSVMEPITTPIALTRLTSISPSAVPLPVLQPWSTQVIAMLGTDNSGDPFVNTNGKFQVFNVDTAARPSVTGIAPSDINTVLTPFPFSFTGERVTGWIPVLDSTAWVTTTNTVLTDPMLIDALSNGHTYKISLGSTASSTVASGLASQASYGGAAVWYDAVSGKARAIEMRVTEKYLEPPSGTGIVPAPPGPPPGAPGTFAKIGPSGGIVYRFTGWLKRVLK